MIRHAGDFSFFERADVYADTRQFVLMALVVFLLQHSGMALRRYGRAR